MIWLVPVTESLNVTQSLPGSTPFVLSPAVSRSTPPLLEVVGTSVIVNSSLAAPPPLERLHTEPLLLRVE